MNKYSLGFGLGLGTIIISYYYYKKCLQNNKEQKKDESKKEQKVDNESEKIVLDNMNIYNTNNDTDKIIQEVLNGILDEIVNEENNPTNQWTLVE